MFITGSDEHGQKIEDKAKEVGKEPFEFVSEIIETFKSLWVDLGIEYDVFLRTTDIKHKTYITKTFNEFLEKDFIYKGEYTGLYCKSDEAYFTSTQAPGKNCPECGKKLIELSESSYFLKISNFQEWIKNKLINSEILLSKKGVDELVNNFVNNLRDLSITRTTFKWGIRVKEDELHVIYVWLDALMNYISGLTYPESKFSIEEVWGKNSDVEILQLVGKEIIRFHCIYWPIILKMKGFREPRILAHGWLVSDKGTKFSKSQGEVVDPISLIREYGRDAVRFYLVNNIVTGEDGKFSKKLLEEVTNGILVNKFSNLVARTDSMTNKYFGGVVPNKEIDYTPSKELEEKLLSLRFSYFKKMDTYKFSDSTKILIKFMENINAFIDITQPWKKNGQELSTIINTIVNSIFNLALLLSPILVDSSNRVYNWLGVKKELFFNDLDTDCSGIRLKKIDFIFKRIIT